MNDATNVLVMVPLCFTAFGSLVSILGLIGARCSNKWLVLGHSFLALPCIVGFAAVGIITGIWLAGFEILEQSSIFPTCSKKKSLVDSNVSTFELSKVTGNHQNKSTN